MTGHKTIPNAWLRGILLPPEPLTPVQQGWQRIAIEYLLSVKATPQSAGSKPPKDYYSYKAMLLAYRNGEVTDPVYAKLKVWQR